MDHTVLGVDLRLQRARGFVTEEREFHLGRDGRIVDLLVNRRGGGAVAAFSFTTRSFFTDFTPSMSLV